MFSSQKNIKEIDQQLEQLNVAMKSDTSDLEKRIIAEALEMKPKVIKMHKPRRVSSWIGLPIAACFALFGMFFLAPIGQNSDEGTNSNLEVVAFDELELQEMWLVQDQLLFDSLN